MKLARGGNGTKGARVERGDCPRSGGPFWFIGSQWRHVILLNVATTVARHVYLFMVMSIRNAY